MIRYTGMIFSLLFVSAPALAGGDLKEYGGRAAGMGRATVIFQDEWSAGNNPAGLAGQKKLWAGIYSENRFLLKELSTQSLALTVPVSTGSFGACISRSGSSLYNEIFAGISYGRNFGKVFSAGIRIHYVRIHMGMDYGNKNLINFSAGILCKAGSQVVLGVEIKNPVPVKVLNEMRETLPTGVLAGLSWQASKSILLAIEAGKELGHDPVVRIGLEYHIANPAWIRIGVLSGPLEFTFGSGIATGRFRFDLASSYHMILGYSPQASVSYNFY